jgi:HPt (histidine-containing phosphotransfer) domain-containing protein
MNQGLSEAKTRLAELATKFLDRTDGDLASMRLDLARLASGVAGTAEIRHLAHRMVGTGATLGFESLSDCARRIELLAESITPDEPPDEQACAALGMAMDALDAELRRLRDLAAAVVR